MIFLIKKKKAINPLLVMSRKERKKYVRNAEISRQF